MRLHDFFDSEVALNKAVCEQLIAEWGRDAGIGDN